MPLLSFRTADVWQAWETHQRWKVEVDWDGDGSFDNAYTDLNAYVVGPVQCVRGRDYASQLTGRAVAGKLQATLRNNTGLFSSFNASSALYGSVRPGLKVRAWALTPYTEVLWTGKLDSIQPKAAGGGAGEPSAVLIASGIFKGLGDQANLVSPEAMPSATADEVIDAVLDAAGHPTADRDLELGVVPIANWFAEEKVALLALQEMEEAEIGFVYEGLDWDVVFENRYHRMLESAAVQLTVSDDPASSYPYMRLEQADAVRDIYNKLTCEVANYSAAALAVLWTLSEGTVYLAPGASITRKATYTAGYVYPWTTPAAGTDVVSTGGTIAISGVVKSGQTMTFTITNSHATEGSLITLIQARGVAYTAGQPFQVESEDSTSQSKYGQRTYPLPSPYYSNAAFAEAADQYFVSRQKDPHPVLTLTLPSSSSAALALQAGSRRISDRINVEATKLLTKLGLDQDFFIESIAHVFGAGVPWETTFLLSPADVVVNYWILGDATYGVLGSTTKGAY